MDRNTIFISYPTDDAIIANKVNDAISKMPAKGLDIFLDRAFIRGGARIPDVIREALKETVYFVAIGTNVVRRNFDWCGQELGFYQASHPDDDRRETCIYDKTIPELFVERKSYKAQSLRKEHTDELGFPITEAKRSELYDFLIEIANLNEDLHQPPKRDEYWRDVLVWAERYASEITDSFFLALQTRLRDEWYPQGRLEINIQNGEFYRQSNPTLPLDSQVIMAGSTYNLFNSGIPTRDRPLSWDSFIDYVKEKTGSDLLIKLITDVIINALPDTAEANNDYVFQAPNGNFYRVLLVKHSVYGDKRRDIVMNFVQTLDKVKAGDQDTTTLVAGIVLGSKYRSIFVEKEATYGENRLRGLDKDELADALMHMLRDIERISADSASDGLADYGALQNLLGDTLQTKKLFDKWYEVFPAMEAAAKQFIREPTLANQAAFFTAYSPFIDVSKSNNTTFLHLCIDEYRKRLLAADTAIAKDLSQK